MRQRKSDKFEQLLSRGKWYYVFFYGVLGLGFSSGFLFAIMRSLTGQNFFSDPAWPMHFAPFLIAGFLGGLFLWSKHSSRKHEFEQKDRRRQSN